MLDELVAKSFCNLWQLAQGQVPTAIALSAPLISNQFALYFLLCAKGEY
jgi:hypothetical protein